MTIGVQRDCYTRSSNDNYSREMLETIEIIFENQCRSAYARVQIIFKIFIIHINIFKQKIDIIILNEIANVRRGEYILYINS